ncbi:single-stranded DNA-binding protein [Sulfodiicoccus acidiphilus]|uniref:Single-stranded DNA-binding protein n=1 Tax=Sulfodiicoccus acidiphilus TaxID=1670455 RepID=A0A348B414_9CREN|nr:OB-fold nucleic acid binding domain-containing protein [Sulfodiicoccus acidiphilus]BBD72916.1 single-stranded DNA-binding protein [Sulfodiicoccus acidiphilus]GGT88030.1 single-stranded DNA-binding protein [Sulfodiicoccus acidiphilus]
MEEKVSNLKPGMENIAVKGRVLEAGEQRVINTKNGPRTLSEAVIGDETGRVKVTLWGNHAGSIKEGQVVRIENAWTTAFRGQIQVNAGSRTKITEAGDNEAPEASEIPEDMPTAPEDYRPPQRNRRFGGGGRRFSRGGRGEEE